MTVNFSTYESVIKKIGEVKNNFGGSSMEAAHALTQIAQLNIVVRGAVGMETGEHE